MVELHVGDCRDVMSTLEASSVDAIVTDPPYGIGFMGKGWDHGVPGGDFWREALRVAKPGAHLLAFGGTRTFHRLACAIEDAGWEIRDTIMWVYGSGFPKSHDVSKAIDKAAGAEREVVGQRDTKTGSNKETNWKCSSPRIMDVTAPATDAARQWSGWGTALKPAWEPIIVARKPLCGTVAETVLRHGTGGINVDGCRVGTEGGTLASSRWPANVIHDGSDEVLALFPEAPSAREYKEPGQQKALGARGADINTHLFQLPSAKVRTNTYAGQTGSAARFFYCAKPSKKERDDGCENNHPTVKPTELMRYLCRLVTPPGGVVLDPFCGSGSTGRGAVLEGMSFVGIDLDAAYLEIARKRIDRVTQQED